MKNQSLLASSNRKRVSRRRKRLRSCRDEEQPPRNEFDVLVNRKRATTQSKTLIFPANINIILFLATTTLVAFLSSSANAFSTPRTLLLRRQSRGFTPPPSSITTLTRLQSQVRPPHQKPPKKTTRRVRKRIAKAVQIYTEYASRLWNETTPEVRQQIEREKASKSIQQVIRQIQHQEDHDTAAGSSSLSSSSSWHDAEDDEYDDDEEEEVEVLLSFEHRGKDFNLVRLLDPILLVGKVDPSAPDNRLLLTPTESDQIMPLLEKAFLDFHDDDDNFDDDDDLLP
mmetsp:Transcript_5854/g.16437  ORF Transcript_5854/g.16437 Transcript_5854/m.16437 type:complete len:284 (-) Transcript_5854:187-1038(-)